MDICEISVEKIELASEKEVEKNQSDNMVVKVLALHTLTRLDPWHFL